MRELCLPSGSSAPEQGYCLQATYTNGGKVYQFCAPPKGTGELPAV
jgi:putative hemolysin